MRVFLNATDLTSEGAICLAEFLPEVKNLIHLDLTENYEVRGLRRHVTYVAELPLRLTSLASWRCRRPSR
jgi:hypothetical protein